MGPFSHVEFDLACTATVDSSDALARIILEIGF